MEALAVIDSLTAFDLAKQLDKAPSKGKLTTVISELLIEFGDESSFDVVTDKFEKMPVNQAKFNFILPYATMLVKVQDMDKVKRGVDLIVKFRNAIPAAFRSRTDEPINDALSGIAAAKEKAGLKDQADYIKAQIAAK